MKKMLNTLYVTSQGAYLFKDGETVAVKIDSEVRLRVPVHTISSLVCFGNVTCSPFLLAHCAENDVTVSFLSEHGRFLARVKGSVTGNVLLRREQFRRADDDASSAEIARSFLIGKLSNSISVINRHLRDHAGKPGREALEKAAKNLRDYLHSLQSNTNLNKLRGIEGIAANTYFDVFDHFILTNKNDFFFSGRNRRPPLDAVNCLLSFVYTLLYHDARAALESVGLDPAVGYLHRDRPGRMGLALDLVEELRPAFADRIVLSLINLGKVKNSGFTKTESGAVLMDDETRKTLLFTYQERKRDEITHPFLQEKIPVGMILFAQAQLLSRFLRGDLDGYPPFIWR
ncbi:MAG: type I-C CRISPR-associated endonuclease Cas1 [Syntrophaceae bacterium]|nr:type I-C CRISPR-associated endonuclease Cas1 [Syntrophaceae bacterium]